MNIITAVGVFLVKALFAVTFVGGLALGQPTSGALEPATPTTVQVIGWDDPIVAEVGPYEWSGVECFEDLSCTNGTFLESWDCDRVAFVDELGRLVRSNGVCGDEVNVGDDVELGA